MSLIISLVFADLLICAVNTTIVMSHTILGSWHTALNPVIVCTLHATILVLGVFAEILSFTLIALERYAVIIHGVYNHERKTKLAIVLIWCTALLVSGLYALSPHNMELDTSLLSCVPNYGGTTAYLRTLNSIIILLSMTCCNLIAYFYYTIYTFYRQRTQELQHSEEPSQDKLSQKPITTKANEMKPMNDKETKLFFKLLTITGTFLVCNTPYLASCFYQFCSSELSPEWLGTFGSTAITFNFVLNPYLLYYLDPIVKSEVLAFLGIRKPLSAYAAAATTSDAPVSPNANANMIQLSNLNDDGKILKDTVMLHSVAIV
jgi:hypothetical protein